MNLKSGKTTSEREALTAAKRSVVNWVNDEERKIGIESKPKRINILKKEWNGVEWYIWIHCVSEYYTTRVFYYVYHPDDKSGKLTSFIPIGTFYDKEGVVYGEQNEC